MLKALTVAMTLAAATTFTPTDASARGRCDGYHGCRCGVTAARFAGLPLNYRGHNLKQAVGFKRALPRVSEPRPGHILYQTGGGPTGHVSTIVSVSGRCTATVKDDRGTYERNICTRNAVFLDPHGNRFANAPNWNRHE
jgi:hypothetical protein